MVTDELVVQLKQGTSAWLMACHGCLTASRLPTWLGFFCDKCILMDKSLRSNDRLAQALTDIHREPAASVGDSRVGQSTAVCMCMGGAIWSQLAC